MEIHTIERPYTDFADEIVELTGWQIYVSQNNHTTLIKNRMCNWSNIINICNNHIKFEYLDDMSLIDPIIKLTSCVYYLIVHRKASTIFIGLTEDLIEYHINTQWFGNYKLFPLNSSICVVENNDLICAFNVNNEMAYIVDHEKTIQLLNQMIQFKPFDITIIISDKFTRLYEQFGDFVRVKKEDVFRPQFLD